MDIAVIAVTNEGEKISELLKTILDFDFYSKDEVKQFGIKSVTEKCFNKYKAIIFISSTGIAVRAISSFIKSKTTDPAIIVIDNSMKFVISLLSGHIGGANELTMQISKELNAMPIITTATDNLGIVAPDMIAKENDLVIENMKTCKDVAAVLVNGGKVAFKDEKNIIQVPKGYVAYKKNEIYEAMVIVGNKKSYFEDNNIPVLKLIRRDIILGVGCKKNYDSLKMKNFILKVLKENNINKLSIAQICTVEIKKNEEAIVNLSRELNWPMKIYTIEEIRTIHHKYKGSDFVEKTIGVRAVSEPVVELSGAKLFIEKLTHEGMTLSIGEVSIREEK